MTTTSADPTPRIQSEPPRSLSGATGASPSVAPPGTTPMPWLDSDIALLKSLRAETLDLARRAANYDTRLHRMLTEVEGEIRKALSALLLQREDSRDG